ncbi:NADPH-dependent FMN reductase [Streptomyces sp. ST2-7A]|uniref:NADPH-dependent FMN reductase n=1 Tax=Streptomyces sp. ST2-7A TaxID=2907214 RepID=UPI001F1A6D5B|nr:NAD(P)H-dependent oxidoreductase [Streptomyces sp. ST2-7A]MCE7083349.1 NAD(P)H-dependent oxidoreductase [Streptomyces sp. ST2-7A]
MSTEVIRLAVIIGSVREGRFGPTVTEWFVSEAEPREDITVDVIDLADVPLSLAGPVREPSAEMAEALDRVSPRIDRADAFVVVTPEYNHSFPAALKNAIDWHLTQWRAKPVGFVSYGGFSGGLRAIEQLRLVFGELHAVTVRDCVSFHGGAAAFDDNGRPNDVAGSDAAAKTLLDQLAWWALALKEARTKRPYAS